MIECRYCGRYGSAETCRGCGAPHRSQHISREQYTALDYSRRNRVNNALQSAKDRRFSSLSILEHLGETDPEATIKEWMQAQ